MKFIVPKKWVILVELFFCLFFLNLYPNFYTIKAAEPSLYFEPSFIEVPVGNIFEVNITLDTTGATASGVGVKLDYKYEDIIVLGITTKPIFSEYPTVKYDNSLGKIIISGISFQNESFNGKGVVANVIFKTVSPGTSQVAFDFEKGSTRDSNIAVDYGNGDILAKVENLEVKVAGTEEDQDDQSIQEENLQDQDQDIFYLMAGLSDNHPIVYDFADLIDRYVYDGESIITDKINQYADPENKIDQNQPEIVNGHKTTKISESTKSKLRIVIIGLAVLTITALFVYKKWWRKRNIKTYHDIKP